MSKAVAKEETVTMLEVLENDGELEKEAAAVLGGSDHEKCSYPQGYVKRQALYACSTCTPAHSEPAGVCLACSYECHDGHDLIELYTKRDFRCDCGNSRFADLECKLYPGKQQLNSANKYGHNFFGLYCTCERPYPDPDPEQAEDEMFQCVVCEDWIHGRHLGCSAPDSEEEDEDGTREMICEGCMNRHAFLWTYAAHLLEGSSGPRSEQEREAKAEDSKVGMSKREEAKEEDVRREEEVKKEAMTKKENRGTPGSGGRTRAKEQSNRSKAPTSKRARREAPCRLKELKAIGRETGKSAGAVFWPPGWRSKLCSCATCREMYSTAGVVFLTDESDTVLAYENRGKDDDVESPGGHDPLMAALDSLDRVQRLELIHGYNDMKAELRDFLQRFAAGGDVVTADDIRRFFEQQQQSRKRRHSDSRQFYFG